MVSGGYGRVVTVTGLTRNEPMSLAWSAREINHSIHSVISYFHAYTPDPIAKGIKHRGPNGLQTKFLLP